MQLKYIVNGIGIYVEESDDEAWKASVANRLQRDLDISLAEVNEREINQKLLIRPYNLLNSEVLDEGLVSPENSVYRDGLFVNFALKVAFKLEKDCLVYWVDKRYFPPLVYILQLLFTQRNMVFVHSAGIAIKNKGVLLPSFGGIGKTSFISEAVKGKGVKMLGDDFVLLDNNGYLYPYPQPVGLYSYHKALFPEYFRKVKTKYVKANLWNRGIRRLKYILSIPDNTVFNAVYDYKLVPPSLLFEKEQIEKKGIALDSVYVLRRCRNIRDIRCTKTDAINRIVNFCVGVTHFELHPIARMNFNLLAFKEESPSAYYRFSEDVLRAGFTRTNNHYFIDIPEDMKAQDVAKGLFDIIVRPYL